MENGFVLNIGEIYVSKSADGSVITVGDESVNWAVKFGSSLIQYKYLDTLVRDEISDEEKAAITNLANIWFVETTFVFDEEYLKKTIKLKKEFVKRLEKRGKEYSEGDAALLAAMGGAKEQ